MTNTMTAATFHCVSTEALRSEILRRFRGEAVHPRHESVAIELRPYTTAQLAREVEARTPGCPGYRGPRG